MQVKGDNDKHFGKDLNYVYWTDITKTIDPEIIEGKCFVRSEQSLIEEGSTAEKWSSEGEFRFYFDRLYDKDSKEIIELPYEAEFYRLVDMQ